MPRPKKAMPSYRYHVSGQAIVTLGGKDFYLGPHDSAESHAKYLSLVSEYQRNGLKAPSQPTHQAKMPVSVGAVVAEFRQSKLSSFEHNEAQHGRFENLCTLLDDSYGDQPASEFGPRKLSDLRSLMITGGNCRKYANSQIRFIVRIFRHAVSKELIPPTQILALQSLEPLKLGEAKDNPPRQPADIGIVRRTVPFLAESVRDMVQLQLLTGCRPSELFTLTPAEVDRSNQDAWMIRKGSHKTAHRGKSKSLAIVGEAREILAKYLLRPDDEICFRNSLGNQWNKDSYRQHITKKCERHNIPHWTPYQIRHLVGQTVRNSLSAEHVQAALGHSHINMIETYSKAAESKAIEAAKVIAEVNKLATGA